MPRDEPTQSPVAPAIPPPLPHSGDSPPPPPVRIRFGSDADMAFFQEMEFATTWHNLSPEERSELDASHVREALAITHEALLARPGNTFFVAETEASERVGILWFGENRNLLTGVNEAWVYNVSVVEAFRRHGVGRQLMERAEQFAVEAGYPTLGLMVATHNEAARRLYARLGFEERNIIMRRRLK